MADLLNLERVAELAGIAELDEDLAGDMLVEAIRSAEEKPAIAPLIEKLVRTDISIDPDEVSSFEELDMDVLICTPYGRAWLVPFRTEEARKPEGPEITVKGLAALGRATRRKINEIRNAS